MSRSCLDHRHAHHFGFALLALSVLTVGLGATLRVVGVEAAPGQPYVKQSCTGGKLSVDFAWEGVSPAAQELWLDLSSGGDDWQPGTYASAGPIAPSAVSYLWLGLAANTSYSARLHEQLGDGVWATGPTGRFLTRSCSIALVGFSERLGPGTEPPKDFAPPGGTISSCTRAMFAYFQGPDWNTISDVLDALTVHWSRDGVPIITQRRVAFTSPTFARMGLPWDGPGTYTLRMLESPNVAAYEGSVTVAC
jgi:hypothetical protein